MDLMQGLCHSTQFDGFTMVKTLISPMNYDQMQTVMNISCISLHCSQNPHQMTLAMLSPSDFTDLSSFKSSVNWLAKWTWSKMKEHTTKHPWNCTCWKHLPVTWPVYHKGNITSLLAKDGKLCSPIHCQLQINELRFSVQNIGFVTGKNALDQKSAVS